MKRNIIIFILFFTVNIAFAVEGMFPLSEIHKLNLKDKGFEIALKEIYNPAGTSLIDGICKINGCTGSFVSSGGLILTNHHCAFRALQAASTAQKNYLQDGFLAHTTDEEIPAQGYTVRITESYRDVSHEVLSAVKEEMSLAEQAKAIEKKIKQIELEAERNNPGKRAEVAEMFIGKTYVLFLYTYLKDVRLVYAPPLSIGEFGGEVDNWMWPRHTGDFSILRAYVAPDGTPAEYNAHNKPYQPRKFLQVAPGGVDEGDFVFIIGYPARTFRHKTSYYLSFEQDIRLPYVVDLYEWQISVMEKMGARDSVVALKHSAAIKARSNVMKNYRGKLKGLKRLHLVEKRFKQEKQLQQFIDADKNRKQKYGTVLKEIEKIYQQQRNTASFELLLDYLKRTCTMVRLGYTVYEAAQELPKPDVERESDYMKRNLPRTLKRLKLLQHDFHAPTDKIFLKEMLLRAKNLPPDLRIPAIDTIKSLDQFIEKAYASTKLATEKFLLEAITKSPAELKKLNDPFINFAEQLYPSYQKAKELKQKRKGALARLHALFIDIKKQFLQKNFIPDANGTLRLTYGRIRGYSPADAVYYKPITTLKGVIEKNTGKPPFNVPAKLITLYENRDFGQFRHPKLNSVPTAILYDTDTTGGNSGSPVLNAQGQVVGINFDRTFEATINDYAWDESYSRSIGVDIRYVLWILQKFSNADFLLQEMGVL